MSAVLSPPALQTVTFSIVIPHRNRHDLLEGVLRSVAAQRLPNGAEVEVIVVDNGSTDASAAAARARGARVIELGVNRGVGAALNRGILQARGDWVAVLNNDVELAPDWLALMSHRARQAAAWFATGKVLDATRKNRIDGAGDAVCRGGAAWRLGHGRADGPAFAHPRPTYFPSATATLFRRDFFDRAGLFDESFFAYLEDVDLGMRSAALGCRGVYVPEAEAWHRGSETAGKWSAPSVTWITRHQLKLVAKHYSEAMLLRFGWHVLVAQGLWAAMAVSRGRFRAWMRGARLGLADCWGEWRPATRAGESSLCRALCVSEAEIARFQRAVAWDRYWKWYFRFAGPGRGQAS